MIYAEFVLDGVFYQDVFQSWDAYYNATFSPDCEMFCIRVIK